MITECSLAGALFQCLAFPYVVCVYHLTLALYCATTNRFLCSCVFEYLVIWTTSLTQNKYYYYFQQYVVATLAFP